jgi:two-component system, NarL family, sensor histidine kinase UhpB
MAIFARGRRPDESRMSLRLQINLLIGAMIGVFVAAVFAFQVIDTRASVREEIEASDTVASQLLSNFILVYGEKSRPVLVDFLIHLGRVRATEISLRDPDGGEVYHSPPATYKAGRDAPAWYAALVAPAPIRQEFHIIAGDLVIEANASRAVLDGWDDAVRLFQFGIVAVLVGNILVFWLVRRATRPFQLIVSGLRDMQRGAFHTRLPNFKGAEAAAMAQAFNSMAQAIEDNLDARSQVLEANSRLEQNRELALMIQNRIEEERRHIALELHDETGQSVTAIRSLALSLTHRAASDEETVRTAQLIADTAAKLYSAMHDLIPRLRPLALENLEFGDAVEAQVAEWQHQHPQVEFALSLGPLPEKLGDSYMIAIYRILQEATTNALRHAKSTKIEIQLRTIRTNLSLRIRDHGAGLSADWNKPGHFGIRGMQERARTLGGEVSVDNADGGGVQVIATLPLA